MSAVQGPVSAHGPGGTRIVALQLAASGALAFTRADIVVTGADHAGSSYEVRLFLNNPVASASTPRQEAQRYAGRFHVFGHGGCFGDTGHCDVPPPSADPTDLRPPHPLTPLNTYVTVTTALRRLLSAGEELRTVTMVPISLPPRRQDRAPAPELFHYDALTLRTFLTPVGPAGP